MPAPWEKYQSAQPAEARPWEKYTQDQPEQKTNPYEVSIPGIGAPSLIGMAQGLWNTVKSGATLPGDVYAGKVDPISDEGIQRSLDLATIASPGSRAVKEKFVASPAPSAQELKASGRAAYQHPDVTSLEISPSAVGKFADSLNNDLTSQGYRDRQAPNTFAAIEELKSPTNETYKIADLDSIRKSLGKEARNFNNPTEQSAASLAKQKIDDYLANINPKDVVAGDAAKANPILAQARADYGAYLRSKNLSGKLDNAEADSLTTGNLEKKQRTQIKNIYKKGGGGYSPEEFSQMERAAKGNILSTIGDKLAPNNLVGTGVSSTIPAVAGLASGIPLGGILAPAASRGIGEIAKLLGKRSTAKEISKLDEMIRSRAPLADKLKSSAIPQTRAPLNPRMAAIVSALLKNQRPIEAR